MRVFSIISFDINKNSTVYKNIWLHMVYVLDPSPFRSAKGLSETHLGQKSFEAPVPVSDVNGIS